MQSLPPVLSFLFLFMFYFFDKIRKVKNKRGKYPQIFDSFSTQLSTTIYNKFFFMACKCHRFVRKCPLLPLKTLHPFPGELVKRTCTWSTVRNYKHLLEWLLLSRRLLHLLGDFFLSSPLTYWAVRALNLSFPYLILLLPLSELADMSKSLMQGCMAWGTPSRMQ